MVQCLLMISDSGPDLLFADLPSTESGYTPVAME